MTEEQQEVIDIVCSSDSDNKIVSVSAVAGAGKTTTAVNIAKAVKPKKGFYTAFNKGIVTESGTKFGKLVESKTIHALAYKYINPSKIKELSYDMIKEKIPYPIKKDIIDTLDKFFRSASTSFEEFYGEHEVTDEVQDYVFDYANKMYSGKIPCTFNYLLKCFHLMLIEGSIKPEFDLLMLDECQDTTAVTLEIFKHLNCPKKIMLGDKYQNIYSFLDTVNGFDLLNDTLSYNLTKSFRCSMEVAAQVEKFGKEYFGESFIFTGNDELPQRKDNNTVYLSQTNASLILRMYKLLQRGERFSTVRSLDEIFALPFAIVFAASGKKQTGSSPYRFIEIEYEKWTEYRRWGGTKTFFAHLDELGLEEVSSAVKTLGMLREKGINIFNLKKDIKNIVPSQNIVLSTAHAYKGLEKTVAVLEKNLTRGLNKDPKSQEMQNLYYVALSRAQHEIIIL